MSEADMTQARRDLEICNACGYCNGLCAVFPAAERRRSFAQADLNYLANLCHNCRSCFNDCQYAPPHAFDLNLPRSLSLVRHQSYGRVAGPLATAIIALLAILLVGMMANWTGAGFYGVLSWPAMAAGAGAAFLWAVAGLVIDVRKFWRGIGGRPEGATWRGSLPVALRDALTLRNLGGGGPGCAEGAERLSLARRRFHHALFYGFGLCFAATAAATVYHHLLGWMAPYPILSLPVLLGTAGGLGMVAGCLGLLWLKRRANPQSAAPETVGGDYALLVLLLLVAASGLLLLAVRDGGWMAPALVVHLGLVLAFFVTAPRGKFVHGFYRLAALLRAAMEAEAAFTPAADSSDTRPGSGEG